jgi:hypothetical protein
MRPLQSARCWSERLDGQVVWRIQHAVLPGLTPAQLLWWFRHLDARVEVEGRQTTHYLLWHPVDHVHWEELAPGRDGPRTAGARWRIVERLGARINVFTPTVRKLDETGIVLDLRRGPLFLGRMEHRWKQVEGGTFYDTSLALGMGGPLLRPLVRWRAAREFDAQAWLKHNVEEVGLLEHLVPALQPRAGHAPQRAAAAGR